MEQGVKIADLKFMSSTDMTEEILPKLFARQNEKRPVDTTARSTSIGKICSFTEISEFVSRHRDSNSGRSETNVREIFRRQLSIRLPSIHDDANNTPRRRERPLSEFTFPAKWRKENWDVTPVIAPSPPQISKPEKIYKRPLRNVENSDPNAFNKFLSRTTSKGSLASTELSKYQETDDNQSTMSISSKQQSPRKDGKSASKRKLFEQWPISGGAEDMFMFNQTVPRTKYDRSLNGKFPLGITTPSQISTPGLGSRTVDRRLLDQIIRDIVNANEDMVNVVCSKI